MLKTTLRVHLGQYLSRRSSNPCRNALRYEPRMYQSSHSGGSGGGGGKVLFALGTITVATGGALVYAKYDPSFRKLLQDNVPYSEEAISKTSELIDMASSLVGGGKSEDSSPKLPMEQKSLPPKSSPTPVVKPPPKPVVEPKPSAPKTVAPPREELVTPAPEKATKIPDVSVKHLSDRVRSLENTSGAAVAVHNEAVQKVSLLGQELSSYTTAGVDFGELSALIKTQVNAEKSSNDAREAAEAARSMLATVKKELEVSGNVEELQLSKQTVAKMEAQLKEAEASLHHIQSSLKPSEALQDQLQWAQDLLQEELGSTWEIHSKRSADLLMLDIALRFQQCRAQAKKSDLLAMSRNCDSLLQCLYTNPFPALDWTHQRRAIDGHVRDVKQAFSGKYQDEFVDVALSMLPSAVVSKGVFTEPALKTRFHNMERVARRVATIYEENVSLSDLISSYFQSMMLRLPVFPIRDVEIANEPCDITQLDNHALLDRARYFIDQGDMIQAVRYLNLLQGPSLFVASGWLEEARLLLEVQQIANSLSAYASLLVLNNVAAEVHK
ncbi:hypothetical protein B566_EDAN014683 [Ephemera danica]|nr:hypothetical protein B566_EDAN014683 [Ephemera danica]